MVFYIKNIISGALVLILLTGIIAAIYANTFGSPFVFDDNPNIVFNPSVQLQEISWESIKLLIIQSLNKWRLLPSLSFGLNYYAGGFNVFGFHLVNIAIHITTAFVFYLLASTTLNFSIGHIRPERTREIAFFATLLWAVHPLQVNAVTYVVQRMTSMSALFCLLSVYSYAKARLIRNVNAKVWLFGAATLSGIMALISKENSFMLPFMILGYEFFFLHQAKCGKGQTLKILALTAITIILFGVISLLYLGTAPLARLLQDYSNWNFTLGQRLLTESRVIWQYLSLLFLPLPSRLNLAYDFPISTGLITPPQTLLAILGLLGLVSLMFLLFRCNRLASFALFWFVLNLIIESSIIPLDIIFEHRLYLPSMFLFLALTLFCYRIVGNKAAIARTITLSAALALSIFTSQRNNVWQSEISLWTDVMNKSPNLARAYINLGRAYGIEGDKAMAEKLFLKAIEIDPDDGPTHHNLGVIYEETQNYPRALEESLLALKLDPSNPKPLVTLGMIYAGMFQHQLAYDNFQKAYTMGISTVELYNNWAVSSFELGKIDESIHLLRLALSIAPDNPESHYNLGIAYSRKGMMDEARREITKGMQLQGKIKN